MLHSLTFSIVRRIELLSSYNLYNNIATRLQQGFGGTTEARVLAGYGLGHIRLACPFAVRQECRREA